MMVALIMKVNLLGTEKEFKKLIDNSEREENNGVIFFIKIR